VALDGGVVVLGADGGAAFAQQRDDGGADAAGRAGHDGHGAVHGRDDIE
jgi:hypothetical protein